MTDRRLALILFVLVSTIYYTCATAPIGNAGSHYMLLRAMIDEGQFSVDSYKAATGGDISFRDGHYYSDKPPGTPVIAVPLYALARVLPGPIAEVPGANKLHDARRIAYLAMLPALAGAGVVVLLYYLLRGYGLSMFSSAGAGLVYAFATISWVYGAAMFSHSLSALLVLASIALALWAGRDGRIRWPRALLLGFLLGLAVLVDYSSIILVACVMIYLVVMLRRSLISGQGWWQSIAAFGLGALPSAAFLLFYNTIAFGGPLVNSYTYKVNYLPATNPALTFSTPIWKGLIILLFYGSTRYSPVANKGIFLLMPITLVAVAGLWLYFKRYRSEAILLAGSFLASLLLFSMHFTPDGGSGDSRYLMPVLPLLFIPFGFVVEHIHTSEVDPNRRDVLLFIVAGLIFISAAFILEQFVTAATVTALFDRAQKLSTVAKFRRIFIDIFGNWKNTPLLWLLEAAAIGIGIGLQRLWRVIRTSRGEQAVQS